jgi:hypothetical protein
MPPLRKNTSQNYDWTAAQMPGIEHQAFIASGGFGEVHKVLSCIAFLTLDD